MQLQQEPPQCNCLSQLILWWPWPEQSIHQTRHLPTPGTDLIIMQHGTTTNTISDCNLMGTTACRYQVPHPQICHLTHLPPIPSEMAPKHSPIHGKHRLLYHMERTFITPLQREHNIHIMDLALQYTTSPTTLKILNTCWIYLQVVLLSNITTTDG